MKKKKFKKKDKNDKHYKYKKNGKKGVNGDLHISVLTVVMVNVHTNCTVVLVVLNITGMRSNS